MACYECRNKKGSDDTILKSVFKTHLYKERSVQCYISIAALIDI